MQSRVANSPRGVPSSKRCVLSVKRYESSMRLCVLSRKCSVAVKDVGGRSDVLQEAFNRLASELAARSTATARWRMPARC